MKKTIKNQKSKIQLGINNSPKRRGRPRKETGESIIQTINVSVNNNPMAGFIQKAKESAASSTEKMMFVSSNSLRNIKWLKDGEKLDLLPGGQRTIVGRHVDVLRNSIQEYGMLRPIIVVRVDFFDGIVRTYVADGQHALMACLRLGIPVPYIIINGIETKHQLTSLITYFNSSSKSWKQGDYVNAWAESIEDYKALIKLKQKFDLDYDVVISAATGKDGGQNIKDLKKGLFRMENPVKAHLNCSRVANLLTIIPKLDRWSTRALVRAAVSVFTEEGYTPTKHKKLMEYVKDNAESLKFCTSAKEIALAFLRKGL